MRRLTTLLAAGALAAGTVVLGSVGSAYADPSSSAWNALRQCESSNNYAMNSGNSYYGAYQFDLATWKSVGGTGRPDQASKAEQDFRALYLYRMRGWGPWICADLVGLSEDADGGSGKKPTRGASNPPSTPAPSTPKPGTPKPGTKAPAYPGHQLKAGSNSAALKTFQKQLGAMGYGLEGTGYFGPSTEQAVLKLQTKAGLNVVGFVGPSTWKAAWDIRNKISGTPLAAAPAYPGSVLRKGAESGALQKFQKQLGSFGYGLKGTGYFGPSTLAAVKKLQAKAHLHAVGFVGPETWYSAWNPANNLHPAKAAKPPTQSDVKPYVPATNASCKVGSRTPLAWGGTVMVAGKTYRNLQCFQRQLGAQYGLTGTGYFGSATKSAVLILQKKNHLPKTGKVDAATWKAAWTGK
ncbi:peptidoglycan-binding protein [Nakamurella lactea]|uniref:peptidoglycan-binding protein n=1 Tax=Nakamurella lactea TaxID=459515 RepID=UPI00040F3A4C|nr:peptidoglycan-binding protein [Nakamurella lactea]